MVSQQEKCEFHEGPVAAEVRTSSFTAPISKRNEDDKSETWNHYQAVKIQSTHSSTSRSDIGVLESKCIQMAKQSIVPQGSQSELVGAQQTVA